MFPGMSSLSTFQFEITRDELQKHLQARIKAHNERAEKLTAKVSKIRETKTLSDADLKLLERSPMGSVYGGGMGAVGPQRSRLIQAVVQQFMARIKVNKARAHELDFYASHLPTGKQSFLLTPFDLVTFEFFNPLADVPGGMGYMPQPIACVGSLAEGETGDDESADQIDVDWLKDGLDGLG